MQTPDDVWRALTKMALRLINDLDAESAHLPADEIADSALSAFRDVQNVEQYRQRLEVFVRDILDDTPLSPPA